MFKKELKKECLDIDKFLKLTERNEAWAVQYVKEKIFYSLVLINNIKYGKYEGRYNLECYTNSGHKITMEYRNGEKELAKIHPPRHLILSFIILCGPGLYFMASEVCWEYFSAKRDEEYLILNRIDGKDDPNVILCEIVAGDHKSGTFNIRSNGEKYRGTATGEEPGKILLVGGST